MYKNLIIWSSEKGKIFLELIYIHKVLHVWIMNFKPYLFYKTHRCAHVYGHTFIYCYIRSLTSRAQPIGAPKIVGPFAIAHAKHVHGYHCACVIAQG